MAALRELLSRLISGAVGSYAAGAGTSSCLPGWPIAREFNQKRKSFIGKMRMPMH